MNIDRDELRKLADAATPGPWTVDDGGGYDHSVTQGVDGDYIACETFLPNAAFIAVSRQAVPELLAALEQAEARIQAVRDALDQYDQHMGLPPLISADVIRRALDGDA